MKDNGLIELIIKYIGETKSINPDTDRKLFNSIVNETKLVSYRALNLNILRDVINYIKFEEVEGEIAKYETIANNLGISCVENDNYTDADVSIILDALNNADTIKETDIQLEEQDNGNENLEAYDCNEGDEEENYEEVGEAVKNKNEQLKVVSSVEIGEETLTKIFDFVNSTLSDDTAKSVEIGEETLDKIINLVNFNSSNNLEKQYSWKEHLNEINNIFEHYIFGLNLKDCVDRLEMKKALLLMGVPGTGKTRILKHLLHSLTGGDKDKYELISFSQNTDYTDFVGGLVCVDGRWTYKDGVLTEICEKAYADKNNDYYLGIDEISRGNTEAILGELMTGIEHRDTLIKLKNGRYIVIPSNLYIIGTMNVSDNSTKKLDIATLQRFLRYEIEPQWNNEYVDWLCKDREVEDYLKRKMYGLCKSMKEINEIIKKDVMLGKDKIIGTRAISGFQMSPESLKIALEGHLLPEIRQREENSKSKDKFKEIREFIERDIEYGH